MFLRPHYFLQSCFLCVHLTVAVAALLGQCFFFFFLAAPKPSPFCALGRPLPLVFTYICFLSLSSSIVEHFFPVEISQLMSVFTPSPLRPPGFQSLPLEQGHFVAAPSFCHPVWFPTTWKVLGEVFISTSPMMSSAILGWWTCLHSCILK